MKKYNFIFICVLLISCSNFESRTKKVLGDDDFRGSKLGDSFEQVLERETKEYMQFPDSNILKYTYHVADTEEYQWAYVFENEKLREIQFDVYLGQINQGEKCINVIKKKYSKLFGESKEEKGIVIWRKDKIAVDLVNESEVVGMGKIKMFIYFSTPADTNKRYIPDL